MSDKTEAPTPRRLRKAREEGDSGVSGHAAQAVAFVVAVGLAPAAIRALASHAADDLRLALASAAHPEAAARFDGRDLAAAVLSLTLPLLLAAGTAGAVVYVVQTGGMVAAGRLAPNLGRLNPIAGIRGLVSRTRLFALVRSLAAGIVVGWMGYRAIADHVADLAHTAGRLRVVPLVVSEAAGALGWRVALFGLALGVVDLVVTRSAWMDRLKMSKNEVRREHRDAEGDPQLKAARGRAYQELLAQATVASVRLASVVVVNPTHLACALRYDEKGGDQAPVVVASGEGDLAARIIQAAREAAVPVVRDVPLARALLELEVGATIPEELYEAVAEILREAWEEGGAG
ncbi:MAG: flagellar biosynthesis protein FlhB [Polyangiaceae bacterium]